MTHPGPKRDLIGYGATPPRAPWPNGARIAVNFCINYEEGGERSILNGDDGAEARVSDLIVERRIGTRDLNMESCYNFGSRVGYWRLFAGLYPTRTAGDHQSGRSCGRSGARPACRHDRGRVRYSAPRLALDRLCHPG